jgi:cell division protein FtsB
MIPYTVSQHQQRHDGKAKANPKKGSKRLLCSLLQISKQSQRYRVGLGKVEHSKEQIASMQAELQSLQPQLVRTVADVEQLLAGIAHEKRELVEPKAAAIKVGKWGERACCRAEAVQAPARNIEGLFTFSFKVVIFGVGRKAGVLSGLWFLFGLIFVCGCWILALV